MSIRGASVGPRLAIDVGGTFTDVAVRSGDGVVHACKVSTTPEDITEGIFDGIAKAELDLGAVGAFVHGTTIALNALLEGRVPRTALVTTAGFRDVLEIMRTNRPNMYDLQQTKPAPMVARRDRREVSARMGATGETLRGVDRAQIAEIAEDLRRDGIEAVGICLLNAYVDPRHELEIAELLGAELPGVAISTSGQVSRMWREFERTSTTVINAACKSIVATYLASLERRLEEDAFGGPVLMMQSNGGVMSVDDARERPVNTLMSGPIGGVTGAARLAGRDDIPSNLVTLDIGGTSADIAILDRGHPVTRSVGQVGGWPVMVPMVDIESIGAGGGSITQVDELGGLRVGPESAGAVPGPACYGRGGKAATVTDANVCLGRIDPAAFLRLDLDLDVAAAEAAVQHSVAGPLELDLAVAAEGVVALVNSNMSRMLWEAMLGRGYDPADFALLAFGGGGPLHACEVAETLGIREVIVPVEPGTFSAVGLLDADLRQDVDRMLVDHPDLDGPTLVAIVDELAAEATARLDAGNVDTSTIGIGCSVELRYVGQDHVLAVELDVRGAADAVSEARRLFSEKHERLYGFQRNSSAVELVRVQVAATATLPRSATLAESSPEASPEARARERRIYDAGQWVTARVVHRSELAAGVELPGPCLVEEPGCTTWIPTGHTAHVHPTGALRITVPSRETRR